MTDTTPSRPHQHDHNLINRAMVLAICVMLFLTLGFVTYARLTDRLLEGIPTEVPFVRERAVTLTTEHNGAALIIAEDGHVIADIAAGKGGFIATIDRVVRRERTVNRVMQGAPILIRERADGRIVVYDPTTDWSAELNAFGPSNVQAFAQLLELP
ncbi:MAG: pullulanase [Rhodobacteraceae bacterium]|nr:pullulanase [Paracoccaceae bacterium]